MKLGCEGSQFSFINYYSCRSINSRLSSKTMCKATKTHQPIGGVIWPLTPSTHPIFQSAMCALTLRTYLFVLINYFVQTIFVYYIYDSQTNMNPFGGQIYPSEGPMHSKLSRIQQWCDKCATTIGTFFRRQCQQKFFLRLGSYFVFRLFVCR